MGSDEIEGFGLHLLICEVENKSLEPRMIAKF